MRGADLLQALLDNADWTGARVGKVSFDGASI